jgi:hypothetical protein
MDLLREYAQSHDIQIMDSEEDHQSSESEDDNEYTEKSHPKLSGTAKSSTPILSTTFMEHMGHQLTFSNLDDELQHIQHISCSLRGTKDFKADALEKILVSLQAQNIQSRSFLQNIEFLPLNTNGTFPWTASMASSMLQQVFLAADALPTLVHSAESLEFLSKILRWQACKAVLTVYHWLTGIGPSLLKELLHLHELGLEKLQAAFPSFALLVDHAVRYAKARKATAIAGRQSKKPRVGISTSNYSKEELQNLAKFPSNLYGLRLTKASASIYIPLDNFRGDIYVAAHKLLEDIIWKIALGPSIQKMDDVFNGPRRSSKDSKSSKSRCLNRGAILTTLVLNFETEGVMATNMVATLLRTPTSIFSNYDKDETLARRVVENPAVAMRAFADWLKHQLAMKPAIRQCMVSMENIMSTRLQELTKGKVIASTKQWTDTSTLLLPIASSSTTSSFSNLTRDAQGNFPLSLALPSLTTPSFGIIGIILREALKKERETGTPHLYLSRAMCGQNIQTGAQLFNPSHGNPVRQYSGYAALFQKYFDPSEVTQPYGLSNLLAWMGTGQGERTARFLEQEFHGRH